MRNKKLGLFALATLTAACFSAQAELVTYACPDKVHFSKEGHEFKAFALVQPLSDNWDDLEMEGKTKSNTLLQFLGATHSQMGDGYLTCEYSMVGAPPLKLTNLPVEGLKYCHFHRDNGLGDKSCTSGNTRDCEIQCDTNP